MNNLQEFAHSPNGDRWFLAKDDASGETFVLHRGNPPSGGHETRTSVQEFLNLRPVGPEREALVAILGVGDDTGDAEQTAIRPRRPNPPGSRAWLADSCHGRGRQTD